MLVSRLPILSPAQRDEVALLKDAHAQGRKASQHVLRLGSTRTKLNENLKEFEIALSRCRCYKKRICINHRNQSSTAALQRDFQSISKNIGESGKAPLPVYCVSALKYLDHLDGKKDYGFPREFDTQIPALRNFLVETTLEDRHESATLFLRKAEGIRIGLIAWACDTSADHKISPEERIQLEADFEKKASNFLEVCQAE